MIDLVFQDAFYWLFMNGLFIKLMTTTLTFMSLIISLFYILRKWGDV
ncbi:hypothetical protein PDK24_28215 [Bacillus cereus]|nr:MULTISPECIES: hypothetical protein [Bacillus cereus group]MBX0351802.1 hypothetical protein [Bacillus toyonensis]MDA1786677.1 hypothetical protein [Bacillus cereus]MDA1909655.1 hypothetical protein [Bacillus cereus]MDA2191586.1 hypothetical protein [Bacillus cereus]MDA2208551.1 hypothetical protein [Bacillus cereus]